MAQTCSKCSRANPADAIYCYYDGFVLGQHGRNGGPVAVGSQSFSNPFVFPSGKACRNFNELSLACQEDWDSARDLLQQGFLESFLGGLGRVDLAHAAREAQKFPDKNLGLDQLLAKFPGEVLAEPKLRVEPLEINLGTLKLGDERQFDLHLENQGMRLLHGSVVCADGDWLTLGDKAGIINKHFQFGRDLTIPVKLCSDRLRASSKPVETTLIIESNGGTVTVIVRAEVPIKPFPPGALGGSRSPRQVAEKAKANPKDAALLFEDGTVAAWYKSNGWKYPVQGPAASGLGAVQQFFEALGLTPPPKVEINVNKIDLEGSPGTTLRTSIELKTNEKRPIYGHASSSEPWLEVGRAKLTGRMATINMSVPSVPNRPGEILTAQLTVQSNGNQRFIVPVRLVVDGEFQFGAAVEETPAAAGAFATLADDAPPLVTAKPKSEPVVSIPSPSIRKTAQTGAFPWLHLIPALLLLVILGGIALWDLFSPSGSSNVVGPLENQKQGNSVSWNYNIDDRDPRLGVDFDPTLRFGIVMLKEDVNGEHKKLTFSPVGGTNNTCIKIDGSEHLFGKKPFVIEGKNRLVKLPNREAWQSVMIHPEKKIRVTQYVEIVPGEQSRVLDTCLVYYKIENVGTVPHTVGLRMLLDTFIGNNDGVPFVIPGQKELLTKAKAFSEKEIPDYIEALEKPDPQNPGTVAHLGLGGLQLPGVELEPINKMIICHWPVASGSETRWEPTPEELNMPITGGPNGEKPDSCVFLYWPNRKMEAGEKREMAFTYGLGKIAVDAEGGANQKLGLSVGGATRPGGVFTITAFLKEAKEGQKVTINLPEGLHLADKSQATQDVHLIAGEPYSQVSWRVTADANGEYKIQATSEGKTASHAVKIKSGGLFD